MQKLGFRRYSKILGATGAVCGAVVGVIGFVVGFSGGEVFIQMGPLARLNGVAAGLVGLPLMPVLFAAGGLIGSAVLYWPVRLILGGWRWKGSNGG